MSSFKQTYLPPTVPRQSKLSPERQRGLGSKSRQPEALRVHDCPDHNAECPNMTSTPFFKYTWKHNWGSENLIISAFSCQGVATAKMKTMAQYISFVLCPSSFQSTVVTHVVGDFHIYIFLIYIFLQGIKQTH